MRIEVVKQKLEDILTSYPLEISSVKTKKEFGEKILEILLKGKDITTDLLEEIHRKLFDVLSDGDIDDDYFLELSSVGAEYLLNSLEEVKEHINSFVYAETSKEKILGTILSVEDKTITIEYNNKGQFRKIKIEYDDVLNIGTRVKI